MGHAAVSHPSPLHYRRRRRHTAWVRPRCAHLQLARDLRGTHMHRVRWCPDSISPSCTAPGCAQRIAFYCGQLLGYWFMLQAAE